MKVIILGTAWPYRGGLAVYNERLAHQFQSEGHDVTIYTFTLQYPGFLFPGKTQYSSEPQPSDLVIRRRVNSCNPFNWLSVGRELSRLSPDLLIIKFWLPFMAPCFGTIARLVRRNGHTRVISILDNLIPHESRIGDRQFASYFCNSVDGFVAMSKSVLADVDLFDPGHTKPRVFSPHPLYDNFGKPESREEGCRHLGLDGSLRYLLFFGLIRDYKGLDWLLQAFARAVADAPASDPIHQYRLVVAGEFYTNGEKYLDEARQLGIYDRVVWKTDFVPDSEVRHYFSAADLIVQPYKTATQSGVTQIAYHFEKPMLVTRVGGLAEIVPDHKVGFAVEPDVKAIAEALRDFASHDYSATFLDGIRDEKRKYAWGVMSNAISGLM